MPSVYYCPTPWAVALIGFQDAETQALHFVSENSALPGLHFELHPRLSVFEQLSEKIRTRLYGEKLSPARIAWQAAFAEGILAPDAEAPPTHTLFLGLLEGGSLSANDPRLKGLSLTSLPDLLRSMPKDRTRLAYLKALQKLAGSDQDRIYAVERPTSADA